MTTPAIVSPSTALYVAAHVNASKHRVGLEASDRCACFFCFKTFAPTTIKSWVDANQTALCPHCGIDAVLGSSLSSITDPFLRGMHKQFFSYRSK